MKRAYLRPNRGKNPCHSSAPCPNRRKNPCDSSAPCPTRTSHLPPRVGVCLLPIWIGHPACVAMFSCGCGSSGLSRFAPKKEEKIPRCKPRSSFSSIPRRRRHGNNGAGPVIGDPTGASLSVCRYRACWASVLLPILTLELRSVCLSCSTAFLAVHLGFHCRRPSFLPSFRLLWLYLRSGAPVPWLVYCCFPAI
jgi:hypothetical protein